jgi:hypothetical protein
MAETIVGIKLNASVSGAEQVKKLKEEIKAAEAEAKKIAKEFGESSKEAQAAAEKVTKLAQGLDSFKSIKTQIREATQEAARLSQQFGEFSPEAAAAAQKVAGLKDQMDDLNEKIQALHPDKFNRINTIAKGVANGFQAAQGAMALFGAESEDVQKALLKVQGAMALAQGLEGLDAAGKQLKTLGMRGIEAFKGMTTASKVFLATGLGLLLAGLGAVAAYWDEIAVSLGFAKSEMEKMNDQINIAGQATRTQANDLNFYNSVVQDTTKSEAERKFALEKLKEAGIETNDINLDNADSMKTLTDRTKENILVIAQRARTEAAAQILQEKTKRLLELQNSDLNEQTSAWDNFYAGAVGALMGIDKGAQELGKRGLKNLQTAQQEVTQAQGLYDKQLKAGFPNEAKALENQEKAKTAIEKRKKAQEDAAKAAEKAAQDEKARQAELAKRSEQLILDAELVGKTEVERAEILAKRKFTASVKGFKEGSKEYLAAEKLFNDEVRIAQEKAATEEKSRKEKEQADAIKATDDYYKKQQVALIGNNEALAQLEVERLQAQINNAKQFGQSTVDLELQLAQKKKEIYDADKKAKEDSEKAKQEAQMATLNEAVNAVGALGGILKEGSDAAKAAALLDIAIKTGVGFAQGLDIAQKGAAATGPAAPYAFPIFYAQQVAAVLGAMSRAKAILKGGSGGAGGGGGMGAVGAAPSPMTPLTGGALPEEGQFGGMGRVYVLEGDITKTQTRVRRLRNTSVV